MKHRVILLGLLASVVGLSKAQTTRQIYLVKGNKVVATVPATDVDYISFSTPSNVLLPITLKQGDNTTLVMYNSSDDWDKTPEERKFDNYPGKLVKFIWYADYGYEGKLKITTASGVDVPFEYVTDDEEFGTCWLCAMPEEPITIETIGTEKTTYASRSFVGDYRGYPIPNGNGLLTSSDPTFSLQLSANTSFHATVSGEKTFAGCYIFNDDRNTFTYDEDYSADVYGKKTYGVSGTWFEDGDALVIVNDLNDDRPDNNRYYFVSTSDFTYILASSDAYASRNLIEKRGNDTTSWYYYDKLDGAIEPVDVTFTQGSSIGDAEEALVSDKTGTPLFRYSHRSSDSYPVFTMKGKEAGTYTPESGTDGNLVLDGFGSATYGNLSGTYTVANNVLTLTTTTGVELTFVLNTTTHTYSRAVSEEWDGPESFASAITGNYDSNTASMGMFAITLNHDYAGNVEKGTAKVQVTLTSDWYESKDIIANTASYTYDASAHQLTISGLLVGTADGRGSERINITFDVSADKSALVCNEDKVLRALSGGDTRYVNLKGLTLSAKQ